MQSNDVGSVGKFAQLARWWGKPCIQNKTVWCEAAEMANALRVNQSSSQIFFPWIYFSLSQQNNHEYLLSFTVTNIKSLNVSQ